MLENRWQTADPRRIEQALDSEFIDLSDVKAFVRRYLVSIVAFFLAGAAGALFYIVTTDPIYSAGGQILIEPKLPQYLQQTGVTTQLDTAQIESQIAVMRSEKIAQMVIDGLGLMGNPDFFILSELGFAERLSRFFRTAFAAFGYDETAWPALFRALTPDPGDPAPGAELTEFERQRIAIDLFGGNIDIRRVGVSYAVAITFRSRNPELAAQVANATADSFVREQIETKAAAARQGGEWLEQRMGEMREKMNTATQIAQEFRSRHDYRVRPPGAELVNGLVVYAEEGQGSSSEPTLEELEVTADTYRQMYESFLLSFTNNLSQQSYPVADARVITAATRPLAPSHPRRKLILAFGMLAGTMAGVSVAFVRNAIDRAIRSPRQVHEHLGVKCLGELPAMGSRNGGFGLPDEVAVAPLSLFSERLRRAKFAIRREGGLKPVRSVGITSALPDEGKSMVASNLALLYAMSGLRTVLIDADTEYSVLSRRLLPAGPDGSGPSSPGGIVPRAHRDVDLLPSSAWAAGIVGLADCGAYDIAIVNLPPLASGPEMLAISSQLDGVLAVAEWGRTSVDSVGELVSAIQAHNAPIFGVLLTKVRFMSAKPYGRRRRAVR